MLAIDGATASNREARGVSSVLRAMTLADRPGSIGRAGRASARSRGAATSAAP